jgi:DNA invertase Pin-like site-specific DNA recombinase
MYICNVKQPPPTMNTTTTTTPAPINALYLRVSTHKQGATGLGIEAQLSAIAARNLTGKEFIEVESGKRNRRPQLTAAIEYVKRTGGKLIIAKLDRLARNVAFTFRIKEACHRNGIEVVALDIAEFNTLNVGVVALMAQWEAERISDRTKAALAVLKEKRGEWRSWSAASGSCGAGTDALAKSAATRRAWAADCPARKKAALTASLMAKNGNSLRAIARTLTASGFATSVVSGDCDAERTGAWSPMQVKRMLATFHPETLTLIPPKQGRPRLATA